ncbi:MAG: hypothetical protein R3E79_32980 [Caldilineaceae bacterium]
MAGKYSRVTAQGRLVWFVERLWSLARNLPQRAISLDQIAEFDQNCWFGPTSPPTCRAVAEHAQRIMAADLQYPIILSAEGYLMDGGHRVAKAYLLGQREINAVHSKTPNRIIFSFRPMNPYPKCHVYQFYLLKGS